MPESYSQQNRIGELKTPLKDDELLLTRFDSVEGVSELFEHRIECLSQSKDIHKFDDVLGKHCSVKVTTIGGGVRWFDGILAESQCLGVDNGALLYRLILRPWLWVLSRRRDSWIFHDMTAPEIIAEVFKDYPDLAKYEMYLSEDHPKLEYCVQYRESDMNFVCRLMEQEGISYHFRHKEGRHKLVMGDGRDPWLPIDAEDEDQDSAESSGGGLFNPNSMGGLGGWAKGVSKETAAANWKKMVEAAKLMHTRPYYNMEEQHLRKEEHFSSWIPERRLTAGVATLTDFNFKTPNTLLNMEKVAALLNNARMKGLESYDYPGRYTNKKEAEHYTKARINMERAADEHILATGQVISCFPGALLTLRNFPSEEYNDKEYVALRCVHSLVTESYRSGGREDITQTYRGSYELMRSDRDYAPPMVTERPFVHGPQTAFVVGDSDIPCDEYGRVRVRFHWDRGDRNSMSMYCRVSQVWAHQNWGAIFIPRRGAEVIVEFLEGDPDRPIITGSVYNAKAMPPHTLESQKNITGWRSISTDGKSSGGGNNHFFLDDTKGKELVDVQAQLDMKTLVQRHEVRNVGANRTTAIGKDEVVVVGANRTEDVGKNESISIGGDRAVKVAKDESLLVRGNQKEIVMKDRSVEVHKNDFLGVGKSLKIVAGDEIKIEVGKASIHMKKNGMITIKGFNISVKDDGETTIKGQMVHIN